MLHLSLCFSDRVFVRNRLTVAGRQASIDLHHHARAPVVRLQGVDATEDAFYLPRDGVTMCVWSFVQAFPVHRLFRNAGYDPL
jgi:hypothetical protein